MCILPLATMSSNMLPPTVPKLERRQACAIESIYDGRIIKRRIHNRLRSVFIQLHYTEHFEKICNILCTYQKLIKTKIDIKQNIHHNEAGYCVNWKRVIFRLLEICDLIHDNINTFNMSNGNIFTRDAYIELHDCIYDLLYDLPGYYYCPL